MMAVIVDYTFKMCI